MMAARAPVLQLRGPDEKDNMPAIRELLKKHPLVYHAERRNSGGLPTEYTSKRTGKITKNFVWFFEVVRCRFLLLLNDKDARVTALDYEGWLTDGRYFGIEVKGSDEGWENASGPTRKWTETELAQRAKIDMICVSPINGVAGFATTVDEAQRILESR